LVPILRSDPRFADLYQPSPYYGTYFMRCNVTREPLSNVELRRAISMAIDRSEIVDSVTCAGEEPAWSLVPWPQAAVDRYRQRFEERTGSPIAVEVPLPWYPRAFVYGASETRSWEHLGYDPDRARAILQQHGYRVPCTVRADGSRQRTGFTAGKSFPSIEYLYNSNNLHERVGELLQAQLQRELGVELRLANQEWGSYMDATRGLRYDTARAAWIGDYIDPYAFLEIFRAENPNNRTGWQHPQYEEALEEALVTVDVEQRSALLETAERILLEELPVIPLYYYVTDGMRTPAIEGFVGNSLDIHFPQFWRRSDAAGAGK
ncbi:MAG: ABC transporter substrate-binding protein, partial [Planctomycetota bacterium]